MKFYLLFFALFLVYDTSHAQTNVPDISVQGIGLSMIYQQINDKEGVYYYPYLMKRFKINDLGLKKIDYLMLYYGFAFQPEYDPYSSLPEEDSLSKLTEAQKGKEAVALANKIIEKNPMSLIAHVEQAYAYKGIMQEDKAIISIEKYKLLFTTVFSSGEGSSYQKPIVVISTKDAETIILANKLIVKSKSMNGQLGRFYDVYLVRNKDGKEYPIYFDITLPYTIGMEKFKRTEK